ncbi:Uu.00g134070.m01.CDS01 [Anthostomella pinea]|uniref:Uu.00g134070.m01.CDS01 n=1 Tax=Anthostomella pinea TaxID=933095 RepID=A0AAI8VPT8_9PEZI|nr:Uu.00g134070.m01.CDS01 [Anthostomella pinea]
MDLTQIHKLPPAEQDAILDGPALPLPPGVSAPNFENPQNSDALAYAAVSICLAVSSLAVLVRFYAKCIRGKKILAEDYTRFLSGPRLSLWLVFNPYTQGVFIGYIYVTYWLLDIIGFFVHQWDVRLRDFWTLLYIIHVGSNFYSVTMLTMKALILREWSRIFVPFGIRNAFWWTCHVVMAINVLFYAIAVFLEDFSCFPYRRIWDKTIPGSQCLDFKVIILTGASINVILDLITLILPQRAIWSLQLSRNKKIGVSLVFAIGVLACGSATSRLVYTVFYFRSDDTAFTLSALSLWLIAEMTCMFIIYAGPAAPKAFAKAEWMGKLKRTLRSWSRTSSNQPTDQTGHSWNKHQVDAVNSRKAYRKIDEFELRTITATAAGESTKGLNRDPDDRIDFGTGIMCTKQFTTAEEYV